MSKPGDVFESQMQEAGAIRDVHYNMNIHHESAKPLKNKLDVTNVEYGRNLPAMKVVALEEPVEQPTDMTRQIPRYNVGTPMDYTSPFNVAKISHNVPHVPNRKPVVIHGVNSLRNSQASVITGEAEFHGAQQGVKALRDTLNYDPIDQIKKDMLRVNKASAVDEVASTPGLHNTKVVRTRTRKRSGQMYI